MTPEKSDPMYDQIYNDLNKKSTDELLDIWKTNDRKVWSSTAFTAIQAILKDRLGSVPPQGAADPKEESDEGTYYSIDKITSIATVANVLAWIILVGDLAAAIAYLVVGLQSPSFTPIQYLSWFPYLLPGVFFFGALRVLSESMYLLLEIAENSRTR
jgi:hypothetical protein